MKKLIESGERTSDFVWALKFNLKFVVRWAGSKTPVHLFRYIWRCTWRRSFVSYIPATAHYWSLFWSPSMKAWVQSLHARWWRCVCLWSPSMEAWAQSLHVRWWRCKVYKVFNRSRRSQRNVHVLKTKEVVLPGFKWGRLFSDRDASTLMLWRLSIKRLSAFRKWINSWREETGVNWKFADCMKAVGECLNSNLATETTV